MVSNLYATEPQAELADRLADADARGRCARVLLQLRRRGQRGRDQARPQARPRAREAERSSRSTGSFHGRTIGDARRDRPAAEAGGVRAARGLVPVRAARRRSTRSTARSTDDVGAVLLEPVLGEGGVRPARRRRTCEACAHCATNGTPCSSSTRCSRVSGAAATGSRSAAAGVEPDVVTLAKALGGGLPIGAMRCARGLSRSARATTRRRSAAARSPCAAALAVLDTIERDGLLGGRVRSASGLPAAVARRRAGRRRRGPRARVLLGLPARRPVAHDVVVAMIAEGVLATEAGPDVVRMSPPLIASKPTWPRPRARSARPWHACSIPRRCRRDPCNGASKSKRQQAILGSSRERASREPAGDPRAARRARASRRRSPRSAATSRSSASRACTMPRACATWCRATPARYGADRRCCGTCSTSSRCRSSRSDAGLVVRTPPGAAAALAEGSIAPGSTEVAGTIAGDNTILIVGREGVKPPAIERSLDQIMEALMTQPRRRCSPTPAGSTPRSRSAG